MNSSNLQAVNLAGTPAAGQRPPNKGGGPDDACAAYGHRVPLRTGNYFNAR